MPTAEKVGYSFEAGQEFRRRLAERVAAMAEAPEPTEDRNSRKQIVLTAVAGVLLVVLTTFAGFFFINDTTNSLLRRLGISTALTAVVYAVVAVLVSHQLVRSPFKPRAKGGSMAESITFGALWGGGAAVVLSGLISLAVGRPTSDARIVGMMFEGNALYAFATVFLAVIAAPFIEEVLFRGLLLESLRARGRNSAILASAVLFSLWHVNPSALRYYVVMGFLLGLLYWRFGLAGSISAHLTFNGVLVVVAFFALATPTRVTAESGVSFELPGGWSQVDQSELGPTVDIAAESPVGSALVIDHTDAPTGDIALPSLDEARGMYTNPRYVSIGGTQSLRYEAIIEGSNAYVVLVPKRSKGYAVTLIPAGSEKTLQQFEKILGTITFPPS